MVLHLFSFSKGPLLKQILHHRKYAKLLQEHRNVCGIFLAAKERRR